MSGSSGNVLTEFLISIGFQQHGQKEFTQSLAVVANQAIELGKNIARAAQDVVEGVAKIARSLEDLYFANMRTQMSVSSIQALSFAVSNLGGTIEGARSSFEGLGRFLRSNPAGEAFIQTLGVRTRETNGQLRDMGAVFVDLGAKFRAMPFFQAQAESALMGIDERTLLAMIQGVDDFSRVYKDMLRASGIDSQKATADAHFFSVEVRTLGAAFDILQQKVASVLTRSMGNDIARFRVGLVANFDAITKVIVWLAEKVLLVGDVFVVFAKRTMDAARDVAGWFDTLSLSSQRMIEFLGGALIAWRLLSTGILATPLGAALALLGGAFLLLYDDYKVWKEGGQSLIDWGTWGPQIQAAWDGIVKLGTELKRLATVIKDDLLAAFHLLMEYAPDALKKFLGQSLTEVIDNAIRGFHRLIDVLTNVIKLVAALASGDMAAAAEAAIALSINTGSGGPLPAQGADPEDQGLLARANRYRRALMGEGDERTDGTPTTRFWRRWGETGGSTGTGNSVPHPEAGLPISLVGASQASYRFWVSKGYTAEGAAGMAAQEMGESGGDPSQRGDGGRSHGLYQWDAARRAAILARTGINVSTATAEQQREAAYQEGALGLDAGAARAMAQMKGATSVHDAVVAGVKDFERSRDQAADITKRDGYGRSIFDRNAGGSRNGRAVPAPPPGPLQPTVNGVQLPPMPLTIPDLERARGLPPGALGGLDPQPAVPDHPLTDVERAAAAGARGIGNRIQFRSFDAPQPLGAVSNDNSVTHAPVLNQNTTINMNGGDSDTARQIHDGQRGVNQDLSRILNNRTR